MYVSFKTSTYDCMHVFIIVLFMYERTIERNERSYVICLFEYKLKCMSLGRNCECVYMSRRSWFYVCMFFYMYTKECMYICLNVFRYLFIYMLASQTRERERQISPWKAI